MSSLSSVFTGAYASPLISESEVVLLVERVLFFLLMCAITFLQLDYTLANFWLYYHNWSLVTLDVSFLMLLADSVNKISPEVGLGAFSWFKGWMLPLVLDLGSGRINQVYEEHYAKLTNKEIYEKLSVRVHNYTMIFFQLSMSISIESSLFYWSFLHLYL